MKISLFITCYNDTLFPETGKAVVKVLERLGHQVEFRSAQTCCGQMHYNAGYQKQALPLMRHFLDVFAGAETISRSGYRRAVNFPPNTQPVSMLMVPFSHSGSGTGVWP